MRDAVTFAGRTRVEVVIGGRLASEQPEERKKFGRRRHGALLNRLPSLTSDGLQWGSFSNEVLVRLRFALHEAKYRVQFADIKDLTSYTRSWILEAGS